MNSFVATGTLMDGFSPVLSRSLATAHFARLPTGSDPVQPIPSPFNSAEAGSDFMCRVKVDSTSSQAWVATVQTKHFQAVVHSVITAKDADIWRLKAVVLWLKTRLDYQAIHTAYLMGSMEEAEFAEESDKYSTEYKQIDPRKIATEIVECSKLLDFELSPADYADFLGVDVEAVLQAAQQLKDQTNRLTPALGGAIGTDDGFSLAA